MSFYQWIYDVPGHIEGIVLAENDQDAKQRVFALLNSKFNCTDFNDIYLVYRGPASDGICMIEEL